MPKSADPFYSRKPIPDELIQGTGVPGLTKDQAHEARERKLSKGGKDGSDLRKFSNLFSPKNDPFYQRKPVPDSLLEEGTGVPGLTKEQAFEAHERKLSTAGKDGTDLRKFSKLFTPAKDPYYQRKPVPDHLVKDEITNIDPVEKYENRERKLSMFTLSTDPFDEITGRRTSVVADSALGVGRRRSSAVAPDHVATAAETHHSGFDGHTLAPIESRVEPITPPPTSASETRHMGLGEPQDGLVYDVVTGRTDMSGGTTMAGSEAGRQIAV